jgi:formylglycine-generating enzyme required for sulfatase activity
MSDVLDLRKKVKISHASHSDDFSVAQEFYERQLQLPLKKKGNGVWRVLIIMFSAIALTTVGIKASDKLWNDDKGGENSLCPTGMVFVSSPTGGFCIDKYEVSAGIGCEYLSPTNQNETFKNIENPDCKPISDIGRLPWSNVSQNQAALICAKAGKRLPTNEEWVRAALGTPDKSSNWEGDDCQVSNNWKEQPGTTGSGHKCISGSGAYDMIGNVWEWVDGSVEEGLINGNPLPGEGYVKGYDNSGLPTDTDPDMGDENYYYDYFWLKKTGTRGMARGGYWGNGAEAGQYSMYVVTEPSYAGVGVGFRCVK